jgi:hypothetical protein
MLIYVCTFESFPRSLLSLCVFFNYIVVRLGAEPLWICLGVEFNSEWIIPLFPLRTFMARTWTTLPFLLCHRMSVLQRRIMEVTNHLIYDSFMLPNLLENQRWWQLTSHCC